ncbi:MAG: hypothetical protein HKO81_04980 [Flavobacteriaceae bacterium]|nr:hypothetical protein [Bacteroidia bacterium]NNL15977.1 hypothetical protein [Flavobacteriaceae bacterium]
MKSKVIKYLVFLGFVGVVIAGIYYLNLSNRHKAIVKTQLLHRLGLVDNDWKIGTTDTSTYFTTPTFVVDNIYKSMEGPKAMRSFQLNPNKSELVWLTSFETIALSTNEQDTLSNDFICHSNVDYYDGEHFSKWNLEHRIGEQYPRLTSMSNGVERYSFPEGFGFPVFTDENLFLASQALNHNITNDVFTIKHKMNLGYKPHNKNMKPLKSKTIFVMLPFESNEVDFRNPEMTDPNACLPVDLKNHVYTDEDGNSLTGHWVIFPGRKTYQSNVTKQLALNDTTSMHHIAVHLHPFAEELSLKDITSDSILFTSEATNFKDKIGLKKVDSFSSEKGVLFFPDHEYELILKVNNTTNKRQDMMASMFVFLYDTEMDEKIRQYNSNL